MQASSVHNFDITAAEYRDFKFIIGTDCEKVLDAGFTGLNTRSGDPMSVSLKYAEAGVKNARLADRIHLVVCCGAKSLISPFSYLRVTNKMPLSLNNSRDIVANSISFIEGSRIIDVLETIDAVCGLAPETLNSLEKLATALNNRSGFFNTVATALNN